MNEPWSPHVPQPDRKYCEQFEAYWKGWIADPENKRQMFEAWLAGVPRQEFHDDERENAWDERAKDDKENDVNTEWTR